MVTDGYQTCSGDHFEMYRNIKSLCCTPGITNSVVAQLHFKTNNGLNLKEKEFRSVAVRGRG